VIFSKEIMLGSGVGRGAIGDSKLTKVIWVWAAFDEQFIGGELRSHYIPLALEKRIPKIKQ
jgi:hypothetical protein